MQQCRSNLPKLLVASCCTPVAELALIRWLSTEVRIFAYVKNLALLLCFLGFGVGCAPASQRVWWRRGVLALLALVVLVRHPWTPSRIPGSIAAVGSLAATLYAIPVFYAGLLFRAGVPLR